MLEVFSQPTFLDALQNFPRCPTKLSSMPYTAFLSTVPRHRQFVLVWAACRRRWVQKTD